MTNLENLSQKELLDLAEALQVLDEKKKYNKQQFLFQDSGKYPRSMYPKHMAFLRAGAFYRERALVAANRTGKTYLSTTEGSFHANGRYPIWWEGKRFEEPVKMWVVGKTHESTRDILQKYLCGDRYDLGNGMIPKEDIIRTTTKQGVPDALQDIYVQHYNRKGIKDGISQITFKSYKDGVDAFMGTAVHVILLDEEPNVQGLYGECLTRTMTTEGIIICTFTPTLGLSDTVLRFLPNGRFPVGGIGPVDSDE